MGQLMELNSQKTFPCFVLSFLLSTLLLGQSCLEFDSLCNQLIHGTSTRGGQEYEA